jgi:hypothetical protein
MPRLRIVCWLAFTFINAGCLETTIASPPLDVQLESMLEERAFESSGFLQISRSAYASTLEPGNDVTVYVSRDAALAYEAVTPDAATSLGPQFPVGGILVRAVSDASGQPLRLTLMVKREPGYFPEAGDFFFAATDLAGRALSGPDGHEWGALSSCGSCHHMRAGAGFMFGVAERNR